MPLTHSVTFGPCGLDLGDRELNLRYGPFSRVLCWAAIHGVAKSWTELRDFTFTFIHWRRKWQPTPTEEPGGLPSMGSHRVGCD